MVRTRDAEAELNMPPGFRFHPTDEELVVHYLCRKAAQQRLPVSIIAEVDLYKYDPWQLPERALFGNKEWYFFTPRDRKYPNGSRPNRAAGSGYWKATGADKPISPGGSAKPLGIKKALVFYAGKAPRGVKTNWIMHEYRLVDTNHGATANKKGKGSSLRLDDWVLCRLYNKKNDWERTPRQTEEASTGKTMDSFEASESLRTPESDVDSGVYADHAGGSWGPLAFAPPQALGAAEPQTAPKGVSPAAVIEVAEGVKEDDEWFMGFNLDDLQSSMMEFGGAPSVDWSCQDFYLTTFLSPRMKPYQADLPSS